MSKCDNRKKWNDYLTMSRYANEKKAVFKLPYIYGKSINYCWGVYSIYYEGGIKK